MGILSATPKMSSSFERDFGDASSDFGGFDDGGKDFGGVGGGGQPTQEDVQFAQKLQAIQINNQFINKLTDQCWDRCVASESPGAALSGTQKNCLNLCAN